MLGFQALQKPCFTLNFFHLPLTYCVVAPLGRHPRALWRDSRLVKWSIPSTSQEQSPAPPADPAAEAFSTLFNQYCRSPSTDGSVSAATIRLQPGTNGRGIFSAKEISSSGKVIFRVPVDTCIVVDYSEGVRLPSPGADSWPRVKRGLAKDDTLPWDIIEALALLDGLAGNGDEEDFWTRYTNEILPSPETLSLPVCLPEELLLQLEHEAIIDGALQQKQRLADLFPGLAVPMCDDGPTYLEWAFGCVRSRAFRLGQDIFAFVPFLDAANHAVDPNANFEMSPDGQTVNLVSLKSIAEGEELCISYTGPTGYSNQRMMAQYGFVPSLGNPFDRIQFKCLENEEYKNVMLSLDALQAALGDTEAMVEAFSGRDTFMYAALKSLPLAAMESDAAPVATQLALAEKLLGEVEAEMAKWKSKPEEDAAALLKLLEDRNADQRVVSVVRYRLQRKRMLDAASRVLKMFMHR